MERIIQAPQVAAGGFAGGVSQGAQSPQQGNELIDLADALGQFSGDFTRAAGVWHGADQDRKRTNIVIQRKDAEQASADIIQNELAGYTAKQMGEALASEPMVKRFAENPYILPAVQIHRGRKAADEANMQMTEAGVDIRNPEAVRAWAKDNLPKHDDPFFSQGFNEQWERWGSQHAQMQFKEKVDGIERDAADMGSTEFTTTFADSRSAGLSVADSVANAFEELNNVPGLRPEDKTQIQMSQLGAAAAAGDLELTQAIANAPRGSAPPLSKDARHADDVAAAVVRAEGTAFAKRNNERVQTMTTMFDKVDAGITREKLESLPEMQYLAEHDEEKWSRIIERHRAKSEEDRKEAARQAAANMRASVEGEAYTMAAAMIAAGRGEFIQGYSRSLAEGVDINLSATQLRNEGVNIVRAQYFPSGFEGLSAPDMARVKPYVRALAASNMKDPILEGFLQGASAYMTPESLAGNEKYLAGAFDVYRKMDPHHAAQYVPDTAARAMYAKMDQLLTANPSLSLDQVAKRAVASVTLPRVSDTPTNVRNLAAAIRLEDPVNPNKGGLFGMGAGPNMVDVTDSQMYNELVELRGDFMQAGLDANAADQAARKEVEGSWIAVHGRPLRMPNDPAYPGDTKESWAQTVDLALKHAAATSGAGGKPEDYVIQHVGGVLYSIRRPDGDIDFLPATRLRALAQERLASEKINADTDRARKIGEAVAKR